MAKESKIIQMIWESQQKRFKFYNINFVDQSKNEMIENYHQHEAYIDIIMQYAKPLGLKYIFHKVKDNWCSLKVAKEMM